MGQALKSTLHEAFVHCDVWVDDARRVVLNATGRWAAQVLSEHAHASQAKSLCLVKHSDIVVGKLFDRDHAYTFQNPDKRVIFVIPYEGRFTLSGTTDVEHLGSTDGDALGAAEKAAVQGWCAAHWQADPMRRDGGTREAQEPACN